VRVELPRKSFDQLVTQRYITGIDLSTLANPIKTASDAIFKASENDLREANRRFSFVSRSLHGQKDTATVPARTLRRWISKYRAAERDHGSGFLGLLSASARRGNRTGRLPARTATLLNSFIENDYETLKQKSRRACWLALQRQCDREGAKTLSYKAFCLAVRRRSTFHQVLKREGHRAAYSQESFHWELDIKTPSHGERPFEIAHIDHTELDIELVCSFSGRSLGRPWFTILMDAFSRRCLAFHLTFDNPSFGSCMMVLRECVYRHARLPQIIVVDGGREFESIYFETLLARYQCTKKSRPPAKARFGSVCERLFGTTNSQFIHNLRGNTQAARKAREMTKGTDPKRQAVWTLEDLRERLEQYLYEIYDTMEHPALGQTPRQMYCSGLAATGDRIHRGIAYDREFYICTLPSTRKGTARVDATRGIKVHYLNYWCESFRRPGIAGQSVPVRYDPHDIGTVYAFVDHHWTECHSEYFCTFHGHSHKEVMLVAEQVRKRRRDHSRSFSTGAKQLAEFLNSSEVKENILVQRLKDLEARSSSGSSEPCQAKSLADDHLEHSANVQENGGDGSNPIIETYGELQG
jgi:transposase InsO family protein